MGVENSRGEGILICIAHSKENACTIERSDANETAAYPVPEKSPPLMLRSALGRGILWRSACYGRRAGLLKQRRCKMEKGDKVVDKCGKKGVVTNIFDTGQIQVQQKENVWCTYDNAKQLKREDEINMLQTVIKEQYKSEILTFDNSLFGDKYQFTVYGQTGGRSYEDREVYFEFTPRGWLRGEDAIALGQALVKHGTKALISNMVNHQAIHQHNCFKRWLAEERIANVNMSVVDDHPHNYGSGFRLYLINLEWVEGKAPKYQEDFQFEKVIYWSPFDAEYQKQLQSWGGAIVEIHGYDREKELAEFKKACEIKTTPNENCVGDVM